MQTWPLLKKLKQEFLTPPLEFDKDKEGHGSPPPSLASISESSECDSDSGRESPIIIMVTSENSPLGKKREFFPLKQKLIHPDGEEIRKKRSDLKKKGDALINRISKLKEKGFQTSDDYKDSWEPAGTWESQECWWAPTSHLRLLAGI